jgi:hypothetical protein
MDKLNKLQNETLAQAAVSESISSNFSNGFKKKILNLGAAAFFGILALSGTGLAHADDFGAATGLSALTGVLINGQKPNNLPPECANVQGVNGWTVGGAGLAGSALGNNLGGGTGKTILTYGLGLLAASAVNNNEQQRITQQCNAIVAENQARINQQNQQRQQQNNYPTNNHNNNTPTANILYQGISANGYSFYVTTENSPGLMALNGSRIGTLAPEGNSHVINGIQKSLNNLSNDYSNLDKAARNYLNIINGNGENQVDYFNPDINQNVNSGRVIQNKVQFALQNFENAYNTYAKDRGIATHILDEAATRNYNLSNYSNYLPSFEPPQSAKVTYNSAYQKVLDNRYATGISTSKMN